MRVLARHVANAMEERKLSKAETARRMRTSRAALDRLLDPDNDAVTLSTFQKAAVVGREIRPELTYNAANQMTQINYGTGQIQTRTYNARMQLTRMTVAGVMDLEYRFSPTQNNGQITQMKNYLSGEEVTYGYDELKRLVSAVTTGPEWGHLFGYDGFGNLLSKTVTKGSAPTWSVAVNGSTNRIVGYGYDANGNTTSLGGQPLTYDVENRLVSVVWSGTEYYGYGPDNKRVWRTKASGATEFYFYGLSGERQGIYNVNAVDGSGNIGAYRLVVESVIPKGMQADRDRLGSVVSGGLKYDPYRAEFTVTSHDRDKFGTYYRDSNTGFNYADQRYYGSSGGRFLTADPYVASAGAAEPGSWNRYAYVEGDPVNRNDPRGLFWERRVCWRPMERSCGHRRLEQDTGLRWRWGVIWAVREACTLQ
ncbi:MAG: hypothetical protein JNL98_27225 [Bryobacterales bacterium]|nr:hypothetical protein [Bryobacterales bacterium]